MRTTIYFDMDGTIANFYGFPNWLEHIINEESDPYENATPLIDTIQFQILISILQNRGFKIGVISWLAKNSSKSYDKVVRNAKKKWLKENFPEITFDEIHIIKYGTRKDYIAKEKTGILFDDDESVRKNWRGLSINPETENIIEFLEKIKKLTE